MLGHSALTSLPEFIQNAPIIMLERKPSYYFIIFTSNRVGLKSKK
uniref:Uncharacterized protein n=1 Tax=Anguilla anguilla TaxID=7936 RepID=A0A0E9UKY3_ANGAN